MPSSYSPYSDVTGLPAGIFSSPASTQFAGGIAQQAAPSTLALFKASEDLRQQDVLDRIFGQLGASNAQRAELNKMINSTNIREQDAELLKKHPELGNVLFGRLVQDDPMARPTGAALSASAFDKSRSERDKTASEAIKNLTEAGYAPQTDSIEEFLTGVPLNKGNPLSLRIAQLEAAAKIQSAEINAAGDNQPKLAITVGDGSVYTIKLSPDQLLRFNEIKQQLATGTGKDPIAQNIEAVVKTLLEMEKAGTTPSIEKSTAPAQPGAAGQATPPNVSEQAKALLQSTIERIKDPKVKPTGNPISDTSEKVSSAVQDALIKSGRLQQPLADQPYRIVRYKNAQGRVTAFAFLGTKWIAWIE